MAYRRRPTYVKLLLACVLAIGHASLRPARSTTTQRQQPGVLAVTAQR